MTDTETRVPDLSDNTPVLEDRVQEDYFGVEEVYRCPLPDGKSWVEHKGFTEGERRKFLSKTNRDVRIARATNDMHFQMPGGEDRKVLLEIALTGWNLVRKSRKGDGLEPVPFNPNEVAKFLDFAPPHIIDHIEKDVRKHNKWLAAEVTVADIDKQISELEEMRKDKIKEEQGNGSSSDK